MQLRDYQQQAIQGVREAFAAGHNRVLLVAPTGAGKTVMFSHLAGSIASRGQRVLLMAHRDELLDQIGRTLNQFRIQHGFIAARRPLNLEVRVQVAGVHTLKNRASRLAWMPDWIVADECFPAGTKVDGKPIEEIRLGDTVKTHRGEGKVTHLFKTRPSSLVTITLHDGNALTCTGQHPIWTQRGFIPAKELTLGDMMASIIDYEQLHHLSERDSTKIISKLEAGKVVRQQEMPVGIVQADYSEQFSKTRRGDHKVQENKRHAQPRDSGTGINQVACNGLETSRKEGKWNGTDSASVGDCVSFGVGYGSCDSDRLQAVREALSDLLQSGCWELGSENCDRSGRKLSFFAQEEGSGREKGRIFEVHRVDGIEVHQQTSCGTFGGLCPDGFVYNLEVENGNTYFANGYLVHNCHHATAGSWAKIIAAYPHARVLGVTATPERLDGKGLGDVFDTMVRGPEVADLIQRGYLSQVRYYCPRTVDTYGMKLRMGDYRHADVNERVNNSRVTGEAVDWYRRLCNGAPAVAFCASIRHSEHVAETFRAAGYRWESLDSRMTPEARRAAVLGLGNGSLHGISSCDIISEGFDLPIVSAAILLRPTASLGLYLQQVGRVLRISPGKTHATIIDHVGNCGSTRAGEWVEKHGFAEDVREWSLEGRTKKNGSAPVRLCEQCFAVVPVGSATCPQCGMEKPPQEKPLPEAADAGDLEQVQRDRIREKTEAMIKRAKTLEDWQKIAKLRGYNQGWAWHRHNQRTQKRTTYKIR